MLKHRILIVEDDPSLVQLLRVAFSWDFEVVAAPDGYIGLQQAQFIEPDLIVLDIFMPHMDGFQFCDSIRDIPQLQNIPIIVMTGHSVEEARERLKKSSITSYIPKPFTVSVLMEQVNRLLHHVPATPKKVPFHEIQQ